MSKVEPATAGEEAYSPIVFVDEFQYCPYEACQCCPVFIPCCCVCLHPDKSTSKPYTAANAEGLFGPGKGVMCYKFEKTPGGWKSHEIFRNAKAVDDYHNMVGRMFKSPLFCCEMVCLGPVCCRQITKPGLTYGEVDECNKVTTSMDGGRCKKAAKDGSLKKLDDPSLAGLLAKFGENHYGWVTAPSINEVERP